MISIVTESPSAIERLKPAFRACPNDFDVMKHEIKGGRVSVYELSGDGYRLTVAGEVMGNAYFIWAVAGSGAVDATRELAEYVKRSGLSAISTRTYFPLVARLLKRLGDVKINQHGDHEFLRWEV